MARKERVLAIEYDRPDPAFDDIGVEFDAAVVEETGEPVPVVQAVTDLFGDRRLGGNAGKLLLEPTLEYDDQRLAFVLEHAAAMVGARAADRLLYSIERGDAFERFAGDRRVAGFGEVEESAAQMRPAEGERDSLAGRFGGKL